MAYAHFIIIVPWRAYTIRPYKFFAESLRG